VWQTDNMRFEFTPAAERAIWSAARWHPGTSDGSVHARELLAALAAAQESRAAVMLAARGVNLDRLIDQWPELVRGGNENPPANGHDDRAAQRRPDYAPAVRAALHAVANRVADYHQPLVLATEHLLLGLVASPGEVASLLADHGFDAADLEAEIRQVYGQSIEPLPIDGWDDPSTPVQASGGRQPPGEAEDVMPRSVETDSAILRIIDAAANRAREALRVVEDFTRFVLDDAHLTGELKHLRHDLVAALAELPGEHLLASRDTLHDVGTRIATASEGSRPDAPAVVTANFKRLQESLRSLEEYGKVLSPVLGQACEALRYRTYTLEKAVAVTQSSLARIGHARLYVLIDGRQSSEEFRSFVEKLVPAGPDIIQLRDKTLPDRELLARARLLRTATAGTSTLFIMNDRPDLAVLARADGVHVGQEEATVRDARSIVGPDRLVGVSTHSIEQARQAVLDGADYIGVGPTFSSGTKQFERFTGPQLLRAVAAEIRLPAFAIGGINHESLPHVLASGINRVAVGGAVTGAGDPAEAVRRLRALLSDAHVGNPSK
jgi:thiamine-phosphate pyrophosphorylase